MRDINLSQDKEERIQSWILILILRLYGQNVYSDDSYVWNTLDELNTTEEIDLFFGKVLNDFKFKHKDLSRLFKLLQKSEDILGR